ncbi:leucyl aminopeptidase [Acinetobacter calcoaceticus]|uniref:Probable cytosol aminopeptidase n=1 Tax=Acinetobacter calcoaceticus TaxID=471 RepID=A0A4R1Y1X9_ACICA|nr:leucyl aminopeptidase [Acinetobacter calcoaceticus]
MKLTINVSLPENNASEYLLILADQSTLQNAQSTYQISDIEQHIKLSQFNFALADVLPIIGKVTSQPNTALVGIENATRLKAAKLAKIAEAIVKNSQKKFKQISIDISALAPELHYLFALNLTQAAYAYDIYKSKKNQFVLEQVNLISDQPSLNPEQINLIHAMAQGQNLARDLGNCPGNICYPEYLAQQALDLAAQYPDLLKVTVLEEQQLADLGMNAFLAVSKGSDRPGRVITIEYQAQLEQAPVVLVGKGVTFDTGGISLKPGLGMDEMKYDMCGAASVLGTLRALCEVKLPIHVVGAIAAAENMPSGHATRPGDVVTTMSGQTVEILNTDAEGRLVLCDTLTYVKRFNPALVIDIATLTGACVVALGKVVSGLFSPDNELAAEITQAGEQSFDRVWRLPVIEDYQELLNSNFADIGNIGNGGPQAGAITAACFLERFTRDYRWAHLDVAGTAWLSGAAKGATGRPVPLLVQFIANRAQTTHD